MLFANQAAASAILVVTLHEHGTGTERALDAVVGGGVASSSGCCSSQLSRWHWSETPSAACCNHWPTLSNRPTVYRFQHRTRGGLANGPRSARPSAHRGANADFRIGSPHRQGRAAARRRLRRALLASEIDRLAQLDPLVEAVLGLARAATTDPGGEGLLPPTLRRDIARLAAAMGRLASTRRPWPNGIKTDVRAATDQTISDTAIEPADHVRTARTLLHATVVDLDSLLDGNPSDPPAQ